jgi:hypothetical protein
MVAICVGLMNGLTMAVENDGDEAREREKTEQRERKRDGDEAREREKTEQREKEEKEQPRRKQKRWIPRSYMTAMKGLDLSGEQQDKISGLIADSRQAWKDDCREREKEFEEFLKNRKKEGKPVKWKEKEELRKQFGLDWKGVQKRRNRSFAALQKQIKEQLNFDQKPKWRALVLAGEAMVSFEYLLDEDQIKRVNAMCIRNSLKINRIKTMKQRNKTREEIERKIYKDILNEEQQKKYRQWRRAKEAGKHKPLPGEKEAKEKERRERQKEEKEHRQRRGEEKERCERRKEKPGELEKNPEKVEYKEKESDRQPEKQPEERPQENPGGTGGW